MKTLEINDVIIMINPPESRCAAMMARGSGWIDVACDSSPAMYGRHNGSPVSASAFKRDYPFIFVLYIFIFQKWVELLVSQTATELPRDACQKKEQTEICVIVS